MTKHERAVKKKYTRIKDTTLFLSIDHQEFTIEGTDKENIKWFQKMLSVALARMIENELAELLEPVVKAARPCPYPLPDDDGTAKDCISKDHCGCDEQDDDDQETDCPIHGKCGGTDGECPRC